MEIVIPLAVVILATLALVYPLVRPPLLALENGAGPWSKLAALEDRKQVIYGAIREASFDFRTDKIGEDNYRQEVKLLKQQAIEIVAEIEALRTQAPRAATSLEQRISAAREQLLQDDPQAIDAGDENEANVRAAATDDAPAVDRFCSSCGHGADHDDRFCAACGARLQAT